LAVGVNRRSRGGRLATAAIAVLGIGVAGAAIADSVRTYTSGKQPQTVARLPDVVIPQRSELAASLRTGGLDGVLYFVDTHCELHAMHLPALEAVPAPRGGACRALVSPATAPPGWSLWPRNSALAAWCERRHVIVSAAAGPRLPMIGGCAPSWRPDGSITYVRRGAIVQFPRAGRAVVLRSSEQLIRAIEARPEARRESGWQVRRVAWLAPSRFAVVASAAGKDVLVVFDGRRITGVTTRIPAGVEELRASPRGNFVVGRTATALQVYDARRSTLPRVWRFGSPAAIAWSRDERWVALAHSNSIVFRQGAERLVIPLTALDLGWTNALR
jgi:hypothetical protein